MVMHYFARAIRGGELARAVEAPMDFVFETSLDESSVLALGPCWRCLQRLLRFGTPRERPGANLVRSPPIHAGTGQATYSRVLSRTDVAIIVADLAELLESPIGGNDAACVLSFAGEDMRTPLRRALAFTRALDEEGHSLVYVIGGPQKETPQSGDP